jgi:BirA family transcriptional regulator, biotin operon repressor / biotin---[acetyl-CoA-carboxylase] ligase
VKDELLQQALAGLSLGDLRTFDEIGSTNDEAIHWAEDGATDFSLVVADSQTHGRGRLDRRWITRPGSALAFSLVIRPQPGEAEMASLFSPLAGLAVSSALLVYGLKAEIKWPNDVLLNGKKVCGILVESAWLGSRLQSLVVGIGVNIAPDSVPPAEELLFPATSVEEVLGRPLERWGLLRAMLDQVIAWRRLLGTAEFFEAWQNRLAFHGQMVSVHSPGENGVEGRLIGIDTTGALCLQSATGEIFTVQAGDVHLRPV